MKTKFTKNDKKNNHMHESKNHVSFRDEIGLVSQLKTEIKMKNKQKISNKQHKDTIYWDWHSNFKRMI